MRQQDHNDLVKVLIMAVILMVLVVFAGYRSMNRGARQHNAIAPVAAQECQYPGRTMPVGCDNTDPCDPATIKDPGLRGNCASTGNPGDLRTAKTVEPPVERVSEQVPAYGATWGK